MSEAIPCGFATCWDSTRYVIPWALDTAMSCPTSTRPEDVALNGQGPLFLMPRLLPARVSNAAAMIMIIATMIAEGYQQRTNATGIFARACATNAVVRQTQRHATGTPGSIARKGL
jgi:hypothetical protein